MQKYDRCKDKRRGCWWDGINHLDGSLLKKAMAKQGMAHDKGKGKKQVVKELSEEVVVTGW
jgi:hypothetical protein